MSFPGGFIPVGYGWLGLGGRMALAGDTPNLHLPNCQRAGETALDNPQGSFGAQQKAKQAAPAGPAVLKGQTTQKSQISGCRRKK